MLKRGVELHDEISESSKGECGARNGTLSVGRGPSEGRSLRHVREGEGDLLFVSVIDGFVDQEVELYGMQPVLRLVIGSVECFRDANAQFSGFFRHCGWGREAGEEWE